MRTEHFLVLLTLNLMVVRTAVAETLTDMEVCSAGLKSAMYVGVGISKKVFPIYQNSYEEGGKIIHLFSSPHKKTDLDACFIDNGRIVWRNEKWSGGTKDRWRNQVKDESYTYSMSGNAINIKITFNDGSGTIESWPIQDLQNAARAKILKQVKPIKAEKGIRSGSNELLAINEGNCSPKAKTAVIQFLRKNGM